MPRPSNRSRILDAAETVAVEMGAAHMTLDAVAAKAKVSKGGLLYHFNDKDALLAAMMQRYTMRCLDKRAEHCKMMGGDGVAMLKVMILNMCDDKSTPMRLHHTLLTAGANNPRMLDPVRAHAQRTMETIRATFRQPEAALALVLAADGMRFLDIMQFQPFTPEERQAVVKRLLESAEKLETHTTERAKKQPALKAMPEPRGRKGALTTEKPHHHG